MKKDLYLICDNIRSIYNVGSIFRIADALGIKKIFLCSYTGTPLNHKLAKTALGAEKNVDWEYHFNTWRIIEKLKKEGVKIVALETNNNLPYFKYKPKFPLALIVGNEVRGLSSNILKRCDEIIYIPMKGKKESLNVAIAFAVVGYKIRELEWKKNLK